MNKYHSHPVDYGGYHFDSTAEYTRYCQLRLLQEAGEIGRLSVHPVYELQGAYTTRDGRKIRPVTYEADFAYTERGVTVVEDVKGIETDVFKLKRKIFELVYPTTELRIVKVR